jgi:hypothetical protein
MPQPSLCNSDPARAAPTTAIVDFDIGNSRGLVIVIVDAVAVEQFVHELYEFVWADTMTEAADYLTMRIHCKNRKCVHGFEFLLNNELDDPSLHYLKYIDNFANQGRQGKS